MPSAPFIFFRSLLIFLFFCCLSPAVGAQDKTQGPDPFLQSWIQLNNKWKWNFFKSDEPTKEGRNKDLQELQALSYLQGYSNAPIFKNVTLYDKQQAFPGYNLFLSADRPSAELMDMRGTVVHQWYFPCSSLPVEKQFCTDYWVRAHVFSNGDLLVLVPYVGLLKIDKQSHLLWFTRIICHHDFAVDAHGNIYTFTVKSSRLSDGAPIKIDSITILSPEGKLIKEISLYGLFQKYPDPAYIKKINQLGHLKDFFYTHTGDKIRLFVPGDAFHSNSIQVLDGKWADRVPVFKKGNLLVNLRRPGLMIVVDPQSERIEWVLDSLFWNIGQHYARLLDNGHILVFDNYYNYKKKLSRVVEFDPVDKKIIWDYSNQNGRFYSYIAGECSRLPNGNTLINESANGHVIEVTPAKKIVWEFYNPRRAGKNKHLIAVIFQMQRLPAGLVSSWLKQNLIAQEK